MKMEIDLENCVQLESGEFLCWDNNDNRCYFIDLKKRNVTADNIKSGDLLKLFDKIGKRFKRE
jgi:hypothetical protein